MTSANPRSPGHSSASGSVCAASMQARPSLRSSATSGASIVTTRDRRSQGTRNRQSGTCSAARAAASVNHSFKTGHRVRRQSARNARRELTQGSARARRARSLFHSLPIQALRPLQDKRPRRLDPPLLPRERPSNRSLRPAWTAPAGRETGTAPRHPDSGLRAPGRGGTAPRAGLRAKDRTAPSLKGGV